MLCVLAVITIVFCATAYAQDEPVTLPTVLPNLITAALGVFAPVVIQFVVNRVNSENTRLYIAIALSIMTGVISYYIAPPDYPMAVRLAIVFTYIQLSYKAFWKVLWDKYFPRMRVPVTRRLR